VPDFPGIEVAYALPGRQRVVRLRLERPMSAEEAVRASGLLEEFPELAGQALALGIYGRRVEGTQILRAGDRVEIYRPLKVDPRDARRRAAAR
jgi:uncharacterized protein